MRALVSQTFKSGMKRQKSKKPGRYLYLLKLNLISPIHDFWRLSESSTLAFSIRVVCMDLPWPCAFGQKCHIFYVLYSAPSHYILGWQRIFNLCLYWFFPHSHLLLEELVRKRNTSVETCLYLSKHRVEMPMLELLGPFLSHAWSCGSIKKKYFFPPSKFF